MLEHHVLFYDGYTNTISNTSRRTLTETSEIITDIFKRGDRSLNLTIIDPSGNYQRRRLPDLVVIHMEIDLEASVGKLLLYFSPSCSVH